MLILTRELKLKDSKDCIVKKDGFTIIEVMVALAVVGISLGVFISILGNSMRMRWKLEDHSEELFVARVTAEKFRLGLLEENMEGETEDGIKWEVVPIEITKRKNRDESDIFSNLDDSQGLFGDEEDEAQKRMGFFNVTVGGINVSSSLKSVKEDE